MLRAEALDSQRSRLRELLASYDSVIVAFSGGVDSAYLAWAATQVLGQSALCITADSPSYPDRHRQLALRVAREFGLRHEIIQTIGARSRRIPRQSGQSLLLLQARALYAPRPPLPPIVDSRSIADGSNADDRGDYRPGRQAAREFGVRSPLDEAGLDQGRDPRASRRAGLPTWDEPASACLSSRIPYHSEVTPEKLRSIERAEEVLAHAGLSRVPRPPSRAGGIWKRITVDARATRDRGRRTATRAGAGDSQPDRGRDPGRWLSTRDDRSPGLSHGQSERGSSSRSDLANAGAFSPLALTHHRTSARPNPRTLLRHTSQVFVHSCRH